MKKLLIAILLLASTALTSYAGDRLPREEPFSFSDVVLALVCAILIPLFMALIVKTIFVPLMTVCIILCSCKSKEHKNEQLSTTIDSTLQVKATSILENKLTELNALSGQAIIMEAQTGNIKAMVGLERKDSADYWQHWKQVKSN